MKPWGILALWLLPASALAQDAADPPAGAVRLGPLAATPRVGVTGVGIDTNVFNTVDDPKRDFTATLAPQTDLWLRLGRARITGSVKLHYVHFARYATERAVNTYSQARLDLPLNRIVAYAAGSVVHARERSGYDVDVRARRREETVTLGANVRARPKTELELAAWRTDVGFRAGEVFRGASLADALDRTALGLRASVHHKITPLTTMVLDVETQRDRFRAASARDARSLRIMPGVDLDRFALVSGRARVGYRRHDALNPGMPGFNGVVASADLGYTLRGITRFALHVERDLAYAFEIEDPYYLQTGLSGTVTQKITGRWDLQASAARYGLSYRQPGPQALSASRHDRVHSITAGLGFTFGTNARLGLNLERHIRRSDRAARQYRGLRFNTSVTYDF